MLQLFRKLRSPVFQAAKVTRQFSSTEQVESLAIEPTHDLYLTYLKDEFTNLYSSGYQQRIPGYANHKSTKYYSIRKDIVSEDHFRKTYHDSLTISSVGIGSYVGQPNEVDDLKMFNGIVESIETGGVNVIDTAINFRYQKSERVVGAALRYLLKQGYDREEFFLCSKNGYIPEDGDKGIPADLIIKPLLDKGKIKKEDIIMDSTNSVPVHCMHPAFLEDQLERTLTNIGVETLDLYYLQNAAEAHLPKIGYQTFLDKLAKSFEFCEKKVQEGKIRSYGLGTWTCFRSKQAEKDLYLGLQDVVEVAKKVGGENHRFRYIQTPYNIIMPEVFLEKWQEVKQEDNKTTKETLFQAAKSLKINVITTSPLAQGLMMQVPLHSDIFKCINLGAKHIQFSRSAPAQALISTIVGQKTARHVKKNLEVIQYPRLTDEEWLMFMKPSKRKARPDEEVEMDD